MRTLASLFLKVAFPRSHFLASAVIKRWQLKARPSIDDKVLLVMWRFGQVSIQDATGAPCRQCRDSRRLKESRCRRLTGSNVTTSGTRDKHVATHLHGEPFVNMTAVVHGTYDVPLLPGVCTSTEQALLMCQLFCYQVHCLRRGSATACPIGLVDDRIEMTF